MRLTAVRRALIAAAAFAALVPAHAAARERLKIHGEHLTGPYLRAFYDDAGPVLVDGGVAYIDEPGDHAHAVYRAPGKPPRRLEQFEDLLGRAPGKGLAGYLELTGDGKRLALARHDADPNFGGGEGPGAVVTARIDGAARTLVRCKRGLEWGSQLEGRGLLVLSGPRGSRCKSPRRPRVFDLVSDDAFTLPVSETASDPTIAGRYAIWTDQVIENGKDVDRGIVYDFRDRRTVQVTRKFEPTAIGRDGTVVGRPFERGTGFFGTPDPCGNLWTWNAEAPAPVELPYYSCKHYATKIVGTRIVFLAPAPGWPDRGTRHVLRLGDTSGSPAKRISDRIAWEDFPRWGFDFDGKRVVYGTYTCSGRRVLTVDEVATALARGPLPTKGCPAEVDAPDDPVNLRRGFDVTLDCPHGCNGKFGVISDARAFRLVPDKRLPLGPGRHELHLRAPAAGPATGHVHHGALSFRVLQPDAHVAFVYAAVDVNQPKPFP